MLNGKFFTGLPPKMMERTTGAQNRLESHLFWPDDTQVDSPYETRTKRRSSLQANDTPTTTTRPTTYQRQTSWSNDHGSNTNNNDPEVNTKERFHKEFAKSSIAFFDNIQEEGGSGGGGGSSSRARRNLRNQSITTKPTAIKMQLPNNDTTQDEYAAIKNKQTFASKIQFYDYVNDAAVAGGRNNQIKPKMDMNDKKEVERHTKNSPKLQVKGIERNLRIVDEQRNNERYGTPERFVESNNDEYERSYNIQRNDEMHAGGRNNNNLAQYERPMRRDVERERLSQNAPRKILKNPHERTYNGSSNNEFENEVDYVEQRTRNMRIQRNTTSPPTKKQVTYNDNEVYEYEAQQNGYDEDAYNGNYQREQRERQEMKTTFRNRAENGAITTTHNHNNTRNIIKTQQQQRQNERQQQQQQSSRRNNSTTTRNQNEIYEDQMESNATNKSNNNFNNRNNTKLNNEQQQQKEIKTKMSLPLTPATTANNDSTISPTTTTDSQKHLRSSLCFYGGEIVANNNNRESTPTSDSSSRHRTARSAATTRRICVGLPD